MKHTCRSIFPLFSVSEWAYISLPFTDIQKVLSLNIPISFVILVMTSTAWHHFELLKKGSLKILQEIVIIPFFLPSICMKLWNLGTATGYVVLIFYKSNMSFLKISCTIIAILVILLAYQVMIHHLISFKIKDDSVVISILANLTTNARPKTAEDEDLVKKFFQAETLTSTFVYSIMATCTATMHIVLYDNKNLHIIFIGFGFVLLHLLFTQLYLWTLKGQALLFPRAMETDPTDPKVEALSTEAPKSLEEKTELMYWKWVILIMSIAITLAAFGYVFVILSQGKNHTSDSFLKQFVGKYRRSVGMGNMFGFILFNPEGSCQTKSAVMTLF